MGRACSPCGEENASIGLVVKPEKKRPLGRPRRKCRNNIKINLK
jgi:hypothetical protein